MTAQIEARRLSGADIGQAITFAGPEWSPGEVSGALRIVQADEHSIGVWLGDDGELHLLAPSDVVTLSVSETGGEQ